MTLHTHPDTAAGLSIDQMPRHRFALKVGYLAAGLCGLLVLVLISILALRYAQVGSPGSGIGASLLIGTVLTVIIPLAAIPVSAVCLWGMVLAKRALRTSPSPEATKAWWLSAGGLMAVVLCYAVFFAKAMIVW